MKKFLIISILTVCSLWNVSYADSALPPNINTNGDAKVYLIGALLMALIAVVLMILVNKKKK